MTACTNTVHGVVNAALLPKQAKWLVISVQTTCGVHASQLGVSVKLAKLPCSAACSMLCDTKRDLRLAWHSCTARRWPYFARVHGAAAGACHLRGSRVLGTWWHQVVCIQGPHYQHQVSSS